MQRALHILRSARFAPGLTWPAAVARIRAETGLDFGMARARSGFARGHLLDVVVYVPGGSGAAHEAEAAEELVRLLLGGELFERWVGRVSATPTARAGPLPVIGAKPEEHAALPLETLPETVRVAIAGLKLGLPPLPAPSDEEDADWVVFELEPSIQPDYAAQDDLILCGTRTPEQKKSFLRRDPCFSGRFSNSGALFTYLKYQAASGAPEQRLAARAAFERALTHRLSPEQFRLVGHGLGLRYDYIDLALIDPDCVYESLVPALREAGIPKRAWLLFCDSELEREYLPAYPETPVPYWG
jgi:hypothetical protein